MPPSIFRTPDFSNQFSFPLEVRKIGIPVYNTTKQCTCTTKQCTLIDVTIPSDRNVSTKEFKKLAKYKDLIIEVT